MAAPSQIAISKLCQEGSAAFDGLISAVRDAENTPGSESRLFPSFQSHPTFLPTIEDCRGRFRVWTSNLGAHQPVHSQKSLDFRLRDAPRMRDSVIRTLQRLLGLLARASQLTAHDWWVSQIEHVTLDGEGEQGPTDKLSAAALGIRSCVDHLFALSILVRRQRPRGRLPSTAAGFCPSESSFDITAVSDKFPRLRREAPWLAQRLGNAIAQRRHVIQYRQQHRSHLAEIAGDPDSLKTDAKSTIATTFLDDPNSANTELDLAGKRASICTFATSFMSSDTQGLDIGDRIPDLDRLVLEGVQLTYGAPFECPYCRTIQMADNLVEWRRHVFSDLQPYICTFQDCPTAARLYSTRHEWMEHEVMKHRRRWVCVFCNPRGGSYESKDDMLRHLLCSHAQAFTENQENLLLEACERDQREFPPNSCPLCEEWHSTHASVGATGSRGAKQAKHFYRHLGHHLQHLALGALPLYIEGLDIQEVDSEPDGEERRPGGLDTASEDGSDSASEVESGDGHGERPTLDSPSYLNREETRLFDSALPVDGSSQSDSSEHDEAENTTPSYRVLFLAASLFEFHLDTTKHEAGYPYLVYQAGEIFEVIAEKGELWLACNQDDPLKTVGWIWSKHCAKLAGIEEPEGR